jgi:hypothetical protein
MGKDTLARFKSLTERGCTPLQVRSRKAESVDVDILPFAAPHGKAPPVLKLPEKVAAKASLIAKEEGRKTWPDEWKDGEKLSVGSAGVVSDNLVLLVSRMKWSHVLAIKDLPFDNVAAMQAFKLDTNTHVIAQDGNHRVLVIAKRGQDGHLATRGTQQWTLAVNGTVDYEVMAASPTCSETWKMNSRKEANDELGLSDLSQPKYLGTIVDGKMFVGAVGIVGVMESRMSLRYLHFAKKHAVDGGEIADMDVIPMEMEAFAGYLKAGLPSTPQLTTGLVLLGYDQWGYDFLKLAGR